MSAPIGITDGEARLLVEVVRSASKRYAATSRRPGSPELRRLQRLKALFLERVASSLEEPGEWHVRRVITTSFERE